MRRINVLEFVSPEGLIPALGGPEKETSGGVQAHGKSIKICAVLGAELAPRFRRCGRESPDLALKGTLGKSCQYPSHTRI